MKYPTKRLGKRRKLTMRNVKKYVPNKHGIYIIRDKQGQPLYVGVI